MGEDGQDQRLDWILIVGPRHLQAIPWDYVEHYKLWPPTPRELRGPEPHPRARRPSL